MVKTTAVKDHRTTAKTRQPMSAHATRSKSSANRTNAPRSCSLPASCRTDRDVIPASVHHSMSVSSGTDPSRHQKSQWQYVPQAFLPVALERARQYDRIVPAHHHRHSTRLTQVLVHPAPAPDERPLLAKPTIGPAASASSHRIRPAGWIPVYQYRRYHPCIEAIVARHQQPASDLITRHLPVAYAWFLSSATTHRPLPRQTSTHQCRSGIPA